MELIIYGIILKWFGIVCYIYFRHELLKPKFQLDCLVYKAAREYRNTLKRLKQASIGFIILGTICISAGLWKSYL